MKAEITLTAAKCQGNNHVYGETFRCRCGKYRLSWEGPNAPWSIQALEESLDGQRQCVWVTIGQQEAKL